MSSAAFLVASHMCTYINKIIVCNSSCWQIKYDWRLILQQICRQLNGWNVTAVAQCSIADIRADRHIRSHQLITWCRERSVIFFQRISHQTVLPDAASRWKRLKIGRNRMRMHSLETAVHNLGTVSVIGNFRCILVTPPTLSVCPCLTPSAPVHKQGIYSLWINSNDNKN